MDYEGEPVKEVGPFRNKVALTTPGTNVKLGILRSGARREVPVTLGTLEKTRTAASAPGGSEKTIEKLGFTVQDLTPDIASRLGYQNESGVVITGVMPGTAAADAGLRSGALILEVNRKPVRNTKEFHEAMKGKPGKIVLLLVQEGSSSMYVTLRVRD
jgi:serine protease Do